MSEETETTDDTSTALVVAEESTLADLTDLGFITPIATPSRLRAAFAEKQRLYAAILDESDYIYTVSFVENGRQQQRIFTRRADAEKTAKGYGVDVRASPKKSGIVKLASALGIEARRKLVRGLPEQSDAAYSYVMYEAMHKRTGRSEEGVGWCDRTERGGRISAHDIIATADTRAYNRAILRLAGFGDVSADEIVGTTDEMGPAFAIETAIVKKPPAALPSPASDEVVMAQRAWAEEASKRESGFLPPAQQTTKAAREMRARARRGNEPAAKAMGASGYTWDGTAQDSPTHESFEVESPTIGTEDYKRIAEAMGDPASPGWNLSGMNSVTEENRSFVEKPIERAQAAAAVPAAPLPGRNGGAEVETITTAQAKAISTKLLAKLGTKEAAGAWLMKHAGVERSVHIRMNQYEPLDKALDAIEIKEG